MEIPKKIKDEIWDYCRVNDIPNIDDFTIKMISQGFTVEVYGATPTAKEVIIEKIIEKVIEVPVEKEVFITDDTQINDLVSKINNLETERDNYKKDMEYFQKELNDTLKKIEIEQNKKRDIYGE
jgi:hypothetical protein